ncbi:MAG TPA: cupin domain-containing protein [Chloroflexia bacterium]|nr:cupin domain-containing protein [Chloroflexia bacterium]
MAVGEGPTVLVPGQGKTVSFSGTFSGNGLTFVHGGSDGAYSLVEWDAAPGAPSTPLHLHRATDEAFYVLQGTFGFRAGDRTLELSAGSFAFVPRGLEHAYWNEGPTPAKMLITISPPGLERYFEELADGLAAVGDDPEAAMSLRKALSEKHDVEVIGPPRQAAG